MKSFLNTDLAGAHRRLGRAPFRFHACQPFWIQTNKHTISLNLKHNNKNTRKKQLKHFGPRRVAMSGREGTGSHSAKLVPKWISTLSFPFPQRLWWTGRTHVTTKAETDADDEQSMLYIYIYTYVYRIIIFYDVLILALYTVFIISWLLLAIVYFQHSKLPHRVGSDSM